MREIGRGQKVFDSPPVRGTLRVMENAEDVLRLMDEIDADGPSDVVVLVRDAGATFLAPLYHDLTGVICTAGTLRSHIGIVTREFQVPCAMGADFEQVPADGTEVELDCSGDVAVIRG
jgi:signal transduction protein with GAF and PtsI domain